MVQNGTVSKQAVYLKSVMRRSKPIKLWNQTLEFRKKALLTLFDCVLSVTVTMEIETCTTL